VYDLSPIEEHDVLSRHQTRRLYNLYCVGADVKPCSIQSNQTRTSIRDAMKEPNCLMKNGDV